MKHENNSDDGTISGHATKKILPMAPEFPESIVTHAKLFCLYKKTACNRAFSCQMPAINIAIVADSGRHIELVRRSACRYISRATAF